MVPDIPDSVTCCLTCNYTIANSINWESGEIEPEHPVMNVLMECPQCDPNGQGGSLMGAIQIDIPCYNRIQETIMVALINFLQGDVHDE